MTSMSADELALLGASFEAVMLAHPGPAEADAALFGLGWGELLAAEPARGPAMAFGALGTSGAASGLLDDVIARCLAVDPSPAVCVVLPAAVQSAPPGQVHGDSITVDGIVSARERIATSAIVPCLDGPTVRLATVRIDALGAPTGAALDPGTPYRRLLGTLPAAALEGSPATDGWPRAVAAARVALAHQLVAAARTMLQQARQHAVDRVQFGRPVSSFQAVRHRLAESLVHIEGAAAVTDVCGHDPDPLLAALAKSLAGAAARTTSAHAQQVLAGIGFTTDHPFQRWLKRVLTLDVLFGSARSLPAEIGAELLTRRDAPRLVEL
jgi:hypothetical protein